MAAADEAGARGTRDSSDRDGPLVAIRHDYLSASREADCLALLPIGAVCLCGACARTPDVAERLELPTNHVAEHVVTIWQQMIVIGVSSGEIDCIDSNHVVLLFSLTLFNKTLSRRLHKS